MISNANSEHTASTGPVRLGAGASTGLRDAMHSDMNFKSILDSRIKEPCVLGRNWALTLNLNRYLKRLCFGTSCNQRWPKCQAHQLWATANEFCELLHKWIGRGFSVEHCPSWHMVYIYEEYHYSGEWLSWKWAYNCGMVRRRDRTIATHSRAVFFFSVLETPPTDFAVCTARRNKPTLFISALFVLLEETKQLKVALKSIGLFVPCSQLDFRKFWVFVPNVISVFWM